MKEEPRILSIIPGNGWSASFRDHHTSPVVCFALVETLAPINPPLYQAACRVMPMIAVGGVIQFCSPELFNDLVYTGE